MVPACCAALLTVGELEKLIVRDAGEEDIEEDVDIDEPREDEREEDLGLFFLGLSAILLPSSRSELLPLSSSALFFLLMLLCVSPPLLPSSSSDEVPPSSSSLSVAVVDSSSPSLFVRSEMREGWGCLLPFFFLEILGDDLLLLPFACPRAFPTEPAAASPSAAGATIMTPDLTRSEILYWKGPMISLKKKEETLGVNTPAVVGVGLGYFCLRRARKALSWILYRYSVYMDFSS